MTLVNLPHKIHLPCAHIFRCDGAFYNNNKKPGKYRKGGGREKLKVEVRGTGGMLGELG
jgi:hypothetical protein